MFTKTSIALALIVALGSGALAAEKRHSTNPAFDVYSNGKYVGSDPDSRIRAELLRDHGATE